LKATQVLQKFTC